ncbi:MAG: hypothetical protein JWR52_535 [Marmoricola sp.]|nr:hypothetical protein [Marmoricola sp.]
MDEHEPGEAYTGPARLATGGDDEALEVEVRLRGYLEPIDGRFHWYGRIASDVHLADRHRAGTTVVVQTPYGAAAGKIADLDPWGRFRITGLGAPPF